MTSAHSSHIETTAKLRYSKSVPNLFRVHVALFARQSARSNHCPWWFYCGHHFKNDWALSLVTMLYGCRKTINMSIVYSFSWFRRFVRTPYQAFSHGAVYNRSIVINQWWYINCYIESVSMRWRAAFKAMRDIYLFLRDKRFVLLLFVPEMFLCNSGGVGEFCGRRKTRK